MAEKMEAKKNMATPPAGKLGLSTKPVSTTKPKKKVSGGMVLAIFLVVVIIAAVTLVYLNVGGLRQILADSLQTEQVAAEGESAAIAAAELEQRQKELDELASDLDAQSATLKKKSQDLKDKETALNDQETALEAREEAVAAAEASVQETQQTQDDIAATAKIFENMEPAVAATAISGLDTVDDMVALLMVIPSNKSAAIISNMEAKLATKVLSAMIK